MDIVVGLWTGGLIAVALIEPEAYARFWKMASGRIAIVCNPSSRGGRSAR